MFVSLSKSIQKDFSKGEQRTMKKKIVRKIYSEMCERFQHETRGYKRHLITFAEYLQTAGETLTELYWKPKDAAEAGIITEADAELIIDRFHEYVKKKSNRPLKTNQVGIFGGNHKQKSLWFLPKRSTKAQQERKTTWKNTNRKPQLFAQQLKNWQNTRKHSKTSKGICLSILAHG